MSFTVKDGTIKDGSGNEDQIVDLIDGRAKAWVYAPGTSPSASASFNVSSITDNASGDYFIDFVSGFASSDHAGVGMANTGNPTHAVGFPSSDSRAEINMFDETGTKTDDNGFQSSHFGTLA